MDSSSGHCGSSVDLSACLNVNLYQAISPLPHPSVAHGIYRLMENLPPREVVKANILVVDDTLANVQLLSHMLAEYGYKVRKVLSGPMALMGIQTAPPDLIILDVNMPEMNGYEVCQQIKANEATQNIPVIFISALDEVTDKIKAFAAGGVDYITKPFQVAEVLVRVEHQLMLRDLQQQLREQNVLLQRKIYEHERTLHELEQAKAALQEANFELQRLAIVDDLTQVANRRHFYHHLTQEWQRLMREQATLSLLLCDVDHFKLYNDAYGHQAGDRCLQQVAQAIQSAAQRPSDLVARYGGEEFAVILPATQIEGAIYIAQKMQANLRQKQMVHPHSSVGDFVTLSIGIAWTIPSATQSPDHLVAMADQSLYAAKKQGRDCIVLGNELL
ncbi:GGDEF domain-containing response regulator [Egbenema bharatensis]|uniref:GGDEF domain-containing response regulator n=1 Tax=Egbenema bharatensis TaxID=3463334 RepID=UPI003A85F75F